MADVEVARPVAAPNAKSAGRSLWQRPWITTVLYSVAAIATLLFINRNATDYVGTDNDDAMRLVEIRDLLAGQSWFDMTQYRLGLDGGTLMHWSRFIDLPIGALISFFRLFAAPEHAEALALTMWPLVLILPLMAFMGLAGRRISGLPGLHISLGLTAITVVTANRFTPGSIDHDNVQLCLAALITAMLVDERFRPWCFAIAGVASAIALAIGVETTPLVAVACVAVAAVWAWEGEAFSPAARAFALALTISVSAAFLSTVPPHLYSTVTCDNLSLGFYGITSVGSIGLLLAAAMANRLSRPLRFAVLAGVGAIVLATALALAPQCLRNPLSDLDPLLVQLWLNNISEAQSILALVQTEPSTIGVFYAAGFLGIVVCVFRILRGERRQLYAILLALLLVNWLIATFQVRGALFANLMSIPPLTLFIVDLRRLSNSDPENVAAAFLYVAGVLVSVPAVWAVGGSLATGNVSNLFSNSAGSDTQGSTACSSREALAPIAHLEPGVVLAPSNLGAPILRFTPHRVLSGPYHRDRDGMLTEIHIGLAKPAEAEAFLRGAKVTLFVYCAGDPQNEQLSRLKPDGLYAELAAGRVPAYLKPLSAHDNAAVQFFRFVP
jgi:hypothetical protein